MNKGELIDAIAAKADCTKKQAGLVLDAFLEVVAAELAEGGCVALVNFGVFEVRTRQERPGRNPQTGEVIHIPAKKVPAFAPGKGLRESIN